MKTEQPKQNIALVIHGGAGNLSKDALSPEMEKEYKEKLEEALKAGYKILDTGGTSLDAVETVVKILEDSPLFNAGKGSALNYDGKIEMDAAIMDGRTLKAGSVAGVTIIKNPITAARKVMERSEHVMLITKGAEEFAKKEGVEIVDTSYFYTEKSYNQLKKVKEKKKIKKDTFDTDRLNFHGRSDLSEKMGTVGAVAIDKKGNLAAATSTGGIVNKRYGRVGDSPIIGAGTYANNKTCAVSCTGHGENFIRAVVAYDISALLEYKKMTLKKATEYVVNTKLKKAGGRGGVISVDKNGHIAMSFNTTAMFRGYMNEKGWDVSIFKEK